MLRKSFESEIQQLKDDVLLLGSMAEQAILDSVEALKKRDIKASEKIFEEDQQINRKRFDDYTISVDVYALQKCLGPYN